MVRGPVSAVTSSQSSRSSVTWAAAPGDRAGPLVDLADALAHLADDGVDRERSERAEPVDGVGLEVELAGAVAEEVDQRVVDDRQHHRREQVRGDRAVADQQLTDHGALAAGIDGAAPIVGGEPAGTDERGGQRLVGGLAPGEVQLAAVQVDGAARGAPEPGGAGAAVGGEHLEDAGRREVLECAVERHSDPRPSNSGVVPMLTRRREPLRVEAFDLLAASPDQRVRSR